MANPRGVTIQVIPSHQPSVAWDSEVYLIRVVGVQTETALIQIQCGFMGPCNALNTHSTLMGVLATSAPPLL